MNRPLPRTSIALLCFLVLSSMTATAIATSPSAVSEIFGNSGVQGGLVVHLGAGDGQFTAELLDSDSYLIEGLETDPEKVQAAKKYLTNKGLWGKVVVRQWDGKTLPYNDGIVALIVADDMTDVSGEEVERVLSPGRGVVVTTAGRVLESPPAKLGQDPDWTHFLHDASNNAVSNDTTIGPPRQIRWVADPLWTRNHHKLNSISSVVVSAGRMFYILDEGSPANMEIPGRWSLFARDASSGVFLWKIPFSEWHSQAHGFRAGPVHLPRLLVADVDPATSNAYVFVKPGFDALVQILDATTGRVVHSLPETESVEEILHHDGILLLLSGDPRNVLSPLKSGRRGDKAPGKTLMAFRVSDGKLKWQTQKDQLGHVVSLTPAIDENGRVFVQTLDSLVCLDLDTGKQRLRVDNPCSAASGSDSATLVATDGVVLVANGKTVRAFDAETGASLWETSHGLGFRSPTDVLVVDGVVWLGPSLATGLDLRTGEPVQQNIEHNAVRTVGHHHRCYRNKATTKYLLAGYRGIEFYDLDGAEGGEHSRHNWTRGTCQYGILPAGGLIYVPPTSCGCNNEAMLRGLNALAPSKTGDDIEFPPLLAEGRLEKGSAYDTQVRGKQSTHSANWSTLRGSGSRGGATEQSIVAELTPSWSADLGGSLTSPVVAEGRVFLARKDAGQIVALDATTGNVLWRFTTDGPIDTPPTWHNGRLLVGSHDGYVYCLDERTGQLAWRMLVAPESRHMVAHDRVESVWPVAGSVLVQNGVAYVVCGRSCYLDGGLFLWGLDPDTGKVIAHTNYRIDNPTCTAETSSVDKHPKEGFSQNAVDGKSFEDPDLADAFSMEGTRLDVLSGDGESVFLRHERFDANLQHQADRGWHLFSTATLADDYENHRSHWVLGFGEFSRLPVAYSWIANRQGGAYGSRLCSPYGLMLAFDDDMVWGVRRGKTYTLFAEPNRPKPDGKRLDFRDPKDPNAAGAWTWSTSLDFRPHAIALAGEVLVLAGMPALGDGTPEAIEAFEGRGAGVIQLRSTADGGTVGTAQLDAAPCWDGLAIAEGSVVVTCRDGQVRCLTGTK